MQLTTLLKALPVKNVIGPDDRRIESITYDSRQVKPGDLFVAIRESSGRNGHLYIPAAVAQGAAAIILEESSYVEDARVTTIQVPNTNQALAFLADCAYDHPSSGLTLTGVTGTNGKTTVSYLVAAILRASGEHVGVIGTAGSRFDDAPLPGPQLHTTPYPPQLQHLLRMIIDRGGRHVVMEVSSHALDFDRVVPLRFQVAVFTNLTRDHLDYHQTYEAYRNAKIRLFRDFLRPDGMAVINQDDPSFKDFRSAVSGNMLTYGMDRQADIMPDGKVKRTETGSLLSVRTPTGMIRISLPLLGRYNVANALAAIGSALALGVPPAAISDGLSTVAVPGRLERIDGGQPFQAIVDYAHTPDALQALLTAVREWTTGRLIVVFGCGGDRDRGKRPEMGRIASRLADRVFITSDNPRTEAPEAIIADIAQGVCPNASYTAMVDRTEAISEALKCAGPNDTVVVAGKGHETYQEIGITRFPFDDRDVIRRWIRERSL